MYKTITAQRAALALVMTALCGCATEQSRTIEVPRPAAATANAYQGPRAPIAIGKFENRSSFMRGMFADAVDRLGGQSKSILIAHL
ncbi:MAG: hypothetical protein ABW005_10195, partial [Burkholderiaceae bacterium]